jgi:hypothetical protein
VERPLLARLSTWWWLVASVVCALGLAQRVAAQEVEGGGGWSPGPGAGGDNTYQGFIDQPPAGAGILLGASFRVTGWAVDMAAEGWAGIDDVQVLNGSTVLAHGSVAGNRPDVAAATGNPFWAASGFDVLVPGGSLQSGPANLTVSVHTPGKGSWTKPLSVTIAGGGSVLTGAANIIGLILTVVAPSNGENVLATHNGVIRGVAYDTRTRAELGVGVDRIQIYLDGPRDTPGSQTLGTANQQGTTWTLAWEPTKYDHVPQHHLWIYARSTVTGEERLVNIDITIVPR